MTELPSSPPVGGNSQQNDNSQRTQDVFSNTISRAISEDRSGNARVGSEQAYIKLLNRNFSQFDRRSTGEKTRVLQHVINKVNEENDILGAVGEDVDGNEDGNLVTATQLKKVYGIRDAKSGQERDYIDYLEDNYADFAGLSEDEQIAAIQASIDAVNTQAGVSGDRSVLSKITGRIAGEDDGSLLIADELNSLEGVENAYRGQIQDYLEYLTENFPQFILRSESEQVELLQYVINNVNTGNEDEEISAPSDDLSTVKEEVGGNEDEDHVKADEINSLEDDKVSTPSDVLAAIKEDVGGNEDGTLVTADQLNSLDGVSGARANLEQAYIDYLKEHNEGFGDLTEDEQTAAIRDAISVVGIRYGYSGTLGQVGMETLKSIDNSVDTDSNFFDE